MVRSGDARRLAPYEAAILGQDDFLVKIIRHGNDKEHQHQDEEKRYAFAAQLRAVMVTVSYTPPHQRGSRKA